MALTSISDLKNLFRTGLKPAQTAFWNIIDSFWHKGDTIPQSAIQGLPEIIAALPGRESIEVAGSHTYVLAENTLLDKIVIRTSSVAVISVGYTVAGAEFFNGQVDPGLPQTINIGVEAATDFSIYITGNCTIKIYTQ